MCLSRHDLCPIKTKPNIVAHTRISPPWETEAGEWQVGAHPGQHGDLVTMSRCLDMRNSESWKCVSAQRPCGQPQKTATEITNIPTGIASFLEFLRLRSQSVRYHLRVKNCCQRVSFLGCLGCVCARKRQCTPLLLAKLELGPCAVSRRGTHSGWPPTVVFPAAGARARLAFISSHSH